MTGNRLVIASNRLPIVIEKARGGWKSKPAIGGLVAALSPVMERQGGLWIGWPGVGDEAPVRRLLGEFNRAHAYRLEPVKLTDDLVEQYYYGFSNRALWPLLHDLLGNCSFDQESWDAYETVNRRFARAIADHVRPGDHVWVHDYHLMLVAREMRRLEVRTRIGYFLHTPFPSADLVRRLPWRDQIVRGLLEFDLLGFHTLRDRRNFVQCVREMVPGVDPEIRRRQTVLRIGRRTVRVGNFPIGIDFQLFAEAASSREVEEAAWYLHENLPKRQLVLGVDRLDYTKGIPERFWAFERLLEKHPELRGKVALVQVVVPSRARVPDYQNLKDLLDQEAGRINARFTKRGWVPIHYVYRSLDPIELLAHYRACEVALITPLRDGMNLVAKEYCAGSVDNNGVLILSEFAGAADQLGKAALLVNPFDVEGTADTIHRALSMPREERERRMKTLRAEVRRNDVHQWVSQFLGALSGSEASREPDRKVAVGGGEDPSA